MNAKHRRTLGAISSDSAPSSLRWKEVEAPFAALGAEISEGAGARIRVRLGERRAVFHRPHPQPETDRGALNSVRRFLTEAGFDP